MRTGTKWKSICCPLTIYPAGYTSIPVHLPRHLLSVGNQALQRNPIHCYKHAPIQIVSDRDPYMVTLRRLSYLTAAWFLTDGWKFAEKMLCSMCSMWRSSTNYSLQNMIYLSNSVVHLVIQVWLPSQILHLFYNMDHCARNMQDVWTLSGFSYLSQFPIICIKLLWHQHHIS